MSVTYKALQGLLCAAALAALPAPAIAQNTSDTVVTNTTGPTYDNTVTTTQTETHHKSFPWGLLGLLGLAGLLGLKRRDDAPDINVDARKRTRP
jgi:Trk-type K+ transport system membrane component